MSMRVSLVVVPFCSCILALSVLPVGLQKAIAAGSDIHDDSYVYKLPYRSRSGHSVAQGYDTNLTHTGRARYSIDFLTPEGTKVLAAREGYVVSVKEDSDSGGPKVSMLEHANYISIGHIDGSSALYGHLRYNGSAVKIGQYVKRGQHIGYSGSTGYVIGGAHLHFHVGYIAESGREKGKFLTVPVRFATNKGAVFLQDQKVYGHTRHSRLRAELLN